MIRRVLVPLLGLMVLAACSAPNSRYGQSQDSAPLRFMPPDEVPDAVPRSDPLLAAGNGSPYTVNGETYVILEHYRDYRERGIASWYGSKFHGYETSNGEIFDLYQASAAHKTLPIPCYARVTNLENGRSIVVRVNDRGPFHSQRLIDLSYGAALKLGYMERGTARVEVAVIDVPGVDDRRNSVEGEYRFLQLGAYRSEASALRMRGELQGFLTVPVMVSPVHSVGELLYRVRVGPVSDSAQLAEVQQALQSRGYGAGQPLP